MAAGQWGLSWGKGMGKPAQTHLGRVDQPLAPLFNLDMPEGLLCRPLWAQTPWSGVMGLGGRGGRRRMANGEPLLKRNLSPGVLFSTFPGVRPGSTRSWKEAGLRLVSDLHITLWEHVWGGWGGWHCMAVTGL